MGPFESERREEELESLVDELEEEVNNGREGADLLYEQSITLLNALGVSNKKANFIYSVLDLEKDPSVESVTLCNSDILAAKVRLNESFRNIAAVRRYLGKHNLSGGNISREGDTYRLEKPELGIAVYFSMKKG